MRILVALFILLFVKVALAADACQEQIPVSLRVELSKRFTHYRTPVVTDNLQEDNEYSLKQGGTGCISVASGDFNGDHKVDYVLVLTALNEPGAIVVVALASGPTWILKVLDEWKDYRMRLYVDTEKPGTYTRTLAADGPLEKGEVEKLVCRNTLPVYGMTESTEVAFCYASGKWPHVWVSD